MPDRIARQDAPQHSRPRPAVATIAAVAYDQELADRIRQLIGSDPEQPHCGGFNDRIVLVHKFHVLAANRLHRARAAGRLGASVSRFARLAVLVD
jgi:AraC-like DNA-binding protein